MNHWTGKKHSKESRERMSLAQRARMAKPEERAKVSAGLTGLRQSPETIAKRSKGMMGHVVTEETRAKISAKNTANRDFFAAATRRRIYVPHSEETKRKISASKKGKPNLKLRGALNAQWRGGRTNLRNTIDNSLQYRQWRSDVFTRDNFTCQDCGERGGKLSAHHIKMLTFILDEFKITSFEAASDCAALWNINNGATLCEACHQKRHSGDGHWSASRHATSLTSEGNNGDH